MLDKLTKYWNSTRLNYCIHVHKLKHVKQLTLKPSHFLFIARSKSFNCFSNKVLLFSIHASWIMFQLQEDKHFGSYWTLHQTKKHFLIYQWIDALWFVKKLSRTQHDTMFFFFCYSLRKLAQLLLRQNMEKLWKCEIYNV